MAQAPAPANKEQMAPVKDISQEAATLSESQTSQPVDAVDEAINKWFVDNVYNSPLSRDTDAFNYLRERVKLLATTLKGLKK